MKQSTSSNRKPLDSSGTPIVTRTSLVSLSSAARSAANKDTVTAIPQHPVNPLWMITAALAVLFGGMAALLLMS